MLCQACLPWDYSHILNHSSIPPSDQHIVNDCPASTRLIRNLLTFCLRKLRICNNQIQSMCKLKHHLPFHTTQTKTTSTTHIFKTIRRINTHMTIEIPTQNHSLPINDAIDYLTQQIKKLLLLCHRSAHLWSINRDHIHYQLPVA